MARTPKKDDPPETEAQAEVAAPAPPAATNLSAGEAAELMSATVQRMRPAMAAVGRHHRQRPQEWPDRPSRQL